MILRYLIQHGFVSQYMYLRQRGLECYWASIVEPSVVLHPHVWVLHFHPHLFGGRERECIALEDANVFQLRLMVTKSLSYLHGSAAASALSWLRALWMSSISSLLAVGTMQKENCTLIGLANYAICCRIACINNTIQIIKFVTIYLSEHICFLQQGKLHPPRLGWLPLGWQRDWSLLSFLNDPPDVVYDSTCRRDGYPVLAQEKKALYIVPSGYSNFRGHYLLSIIPLTIPWSFTETRIYLSYI